MAVSYRKYKFSITIAKEGIGYLLTDRMDRVPASYRAIQTRTGKGALRLMRDTQLRQNILRGLEIRIRLRSRAEVFDRLPPALG